MTTLLTLMLATVAVATEPPAVERSASGNESAADSRLAQMLMNKLVVAEGRDPFSLLSRPDNGSGSVLEADHVFWRTLEVGDKDRVLYGASWDELYRIDRMLDPAELLGKVEVAGSIRGHFASPREVNLMVSSNSVLQMWVLDAEVGFIDTNGLVAFVDDVSTSGVMASIADEPVVVERTIADGDVRSVTMRATLVALGGPYAPSGALRIELVDAAGLGEPFVYGQFSGILADTNGPAVTLPLAGLSLAPDSRLIALSEGDWDPHGCPGLYELTIYPDVVAADRLATVMNESIHAIEFSPDGTLWGAGDALYIIDPLTGADTLVATTGLAPIVDLEFAMGKTLYGVTLGRDEPSRLVDITPDGRPVSAVIIEPAGPYWGLTTRLRKK